MLKIQKEKMFRTPYEKEEKCLFSGCNKHCYTGFGYCQRHLNKVPLGKLKRNAKTFLRGSIKGSGRNLGNLPREFLLVSMFLLKTKEVLNGYSDNKK
jgi:hypothetical protein